MLADSNIIYVQQNYGIYFETTVYCWQQLRLQPNPLQEYLEGDFNAVNIGSTVYM